MKLFTSVDEYLFCAPKYGPLQIIVGTRIVPGYINDMF
jgi:hypothetical protein